MARPAKFTEAQILDAALRLVADNGPAAATMDGIGALLGAPSGSLYHRFRSRGLLLARLWIRTVKRFQPGFLDALAGDDLDAAALHVVRWARDHVDGARVLLLFRCEDLAARWPEELGEELPTLNADVAALRAYGRRRYGQDDATAVQRVTFALVDVPYAAARRFFLAGTPPPALLDDLVVAACRGVLGNIGEAVASRERASSDP